MLNKDASKAVKLSKIELPKAKQAELISRLWKSHRALNHPNTSHMITLLHNSMDDRVRAQAAVAIVVKNLNCSQCVESSRRTSFVPQLSMPRVFLERRLN